MKKFICLMLTVLLAGVAPLALAQEPAPGLAKEAGATLTVTGSASVAIVPDFATLTLGVSTQAETVAAAQEQNAAQMNALLEALGAQGIAKEDLQTSYFSINPVYDYNQMNPDGSQKMVGYRVENSLAVKVQELDKISAVLDGAMAAGANQGYGLNFDSTKRAEAYDQALAAAVKEAKRKAGVLADAAEEPLGALLSINEQVGYGGNYPMAMKMMDSAAGSTPIMSGTLSVEATVIATYQVP